MNFRQLEEDAGDIEFIQIKKHSAILMKITNYHKTQKEMKHNLFYINWVISSPQKCLSLEQQPQETNDVFLQRMKYIKPD